MLKSAEYQCYKAIKARTKIIENIKDETAGFRACRFFVLAKKQKKL